MSKAYKTYGTISNPQKKRSSFKCKGCSTSWIKPVNYYLRRPHPAIIDLVEFYEIEICKKCAIRELGPKNKKRKWFFDEE